jgi:hypothetical protein
MAAAAKTSAPVFLVLADRWFYLACEYLAGFTECLPELRSPAFAPLGVRHLA